MSMPCVAELRKKACRWLKLLSRPQASVFEQEAAAIIHVRHPEIYVLDVPKSQFRLTGECTISARCRWFRVSGFAFVMKLTCPRYVRASRPDPKTQCLRPHAGDPQRCGAPWTVLLRLHLGLYRRSNLAPGPWSLEAVRPQPLQGLPEVFPKRIEEESVVVVRRLWTSISRGLPPPTFLIPLGP